MRNPAHMQTPKRAPAARKMPQPWHYHIRCALSLTLLLAQTAPLYAQAPLGAPAALDESNVTVSDRGTVNLHVSGSPLADVLRLLSIEGKQNIIASPAVSGSVTASLYDVTFDEALEAVLVPAGAGFRRVGKFVYVYTNEELEKLDALASGSAVTRVFPLSYVRAADAATYITDVLGEGGTVRASSEPETGTESGDEAYGLSNASDEFLVVTAPPSALKAVADVLAQIDVRPQQVLIEATILRAELTDDNALGIDFSLVGGVDLELLGAASNGIQDLTLGQLPQDRYERFNANATTDLTGNVPRGGLTFGVIKDHVAIFVRALEQITNTVVVANPKVLALNKQKGQVIVGQRDGYLTTTITETQATQTVEFLETGTQLRFRPFIGKDGFIRVELHPEDSVGFVSAQGLPSEQTTEVTTNVIVRDGETILIGGLFREVTTDSRSQVPGVGNVPLLGQLFRSTSEQTTREEVIILLTIQIVKDQDRFAAESHKLLDTIERTRVGIRRGLMWHGRDRTAQRNYREAVEAVNRGDKDDALWHLYLALYNNPVHDDAIRLRQKLTGETVWDASGSGHREFLHRLIAQERGYDMPAYDGPNVEDLSAPEVDAHETSEETTKDPQETAP